MSLEQFIPGFKEKCDLCHEPIEGSPRILHKDGKEVKCCRACFRKKLGAKDTDGNGFTPSKLRCDEIICRV